MMLFDDRRARELAGQAQPVDAILGSAPEPGVMSGVLGAIPAGVNRGVASVEAAGLDLAARGMQPIYNALGAATGTEPTNYFALARDQADTWVKQFTPDPMMVGAAGQIVGGVTDIMTRVATGAALTYLTGGAAAPVMWGGATAAGLSEGRETYNDLLEKGVDPSTAVNAGFINAVTTGGGALIPAGIGYSGLAEPLAGWGVRLTNPGYVATNAALGAATNVGMGVIQRGATADALRAGGYDTMARQYAPVDGAAMAADAILGGVFSAAGSAANLPARAAPVVDAALAARDAKHAGITTAPGIPADPDAATAHGQALNTALRDVWDGKPVDVSGTGVQDAAFVPAQRDGSASGAAATEYGMPRLAVQPSTRLTDIAPAQRTALAYNAPELNEYAAHVEQQYGLPPGLINALKNAGERSNSTQVSPAGARGVMQFMPENLHKYGVTDPTDPVQMIDAAGRYLADTMRQYGGNVDAVIADYNGGPRQARAVLAGDAPPASETRAYLARVREAMGRGAAWVNQGSTDGAIRPIPQDRARAAAAIEDEIQRTESERADLLADAGQSAELGQVSQIRDELSGLQDQRSALDSDAALRDRTKEIQGSGPRISYKQALSQARREVSSQGADLDAQISRLQDSLEQNRNASQAAQRLADLDQRISDLRANRAAIDVPASPLTPVAAALREGDSRPARSQAAQDADRLTQAAQQPAVEDESGAPAPAGEGSGTSSPRAAARPAEVMPAAETAKANPAREDAPQPVEPSQAGAQSATEPRGLPADDIETRAGLALLAEQGDITVPSVDENGNEAQLSLRNALADANAELETVTPEALEAAILCQLKGGA